MPASAYWRPWDSRVRFAEGIFSRSGYLAGSDAERAAQVNAAFADSDIKAIVCARGGYGSMRILPYLNYEAIRRHPKLLMGFSDITALLCALYQRVRTGFVPRAGGQRPERTPAPKPWSPSSTC